MVNGLGDKCYPGKGWVDWLRLTWSKWVDWALKPQTKTKKILLIQQDLDTTTDCKTDSLWYFCPSFFLVCCIRTVDSLYRITRDSLKYFEISVPQHIRFTELRKKYIKQPHFTNEYTIWLLKLEIYWKYCGKGKVAPLKQFLLFSTVFCYLVRFPGSNRDQIFTSR